ncbi:hypothetical protein ABEH27_18375 [Pseudomonas sp. P39-UII1]|uniref:hypothetical protein n=1 Tax=Pseudomonas sp. P39-UII1 TaxID=3080333 RepID=UPI00320BA9A0
MIDDDDIKKEIQDEAETLDRPEAPEEVDEVVLEPEAEPAPEELEEPEATGPIDPKGPLGLRGRVGLEGPSLTNEENEAFEKIQGRVYNVLKETLAKHDLESATNWFIYSNDEFAEQRSAINFLTWALISGALHKPESVEYSDDSGGERMLDSDGNFWAALQETFDRMMEMPPIA